MSRKSVDQILDDLYHQLLDLQLEYGDVAREKVVSWTELKEILNDMEEVQEEIRRIEGWEEQFQRSEGREKDDQKSLRDDDVPEA